MDNGGLEDGSPHPFNECATNAVFSHRARPHQGSVRHDA